jgi:hypothetical protein
VRSIENSKEFELVRIFATEATINFNILYENLLLG